MTGLKELGLENKVKRYEHHLSHAANAYLASGFDRALVLTLDGRPLSPDDATLWSLGVYPNAVLHAVCAPGAGLDAFGAEPAAAPPPSPSGPREGPDESSRRA